MTRVSSKAFMSATLEDYDTCMNTNLRGPYFLCKLAARHMMDNGVQGGNILNIASSSSARPARSAYALSKWGTAGLTRGLAKSLIAHGIVVNGIAPGLTCSPMTGVRSDGDISLPRNPAGRYTTPEEVADMAVVMVSGMARSIVGDIVYMSGGAGIVTFDDVG